MKNKLFICFRPDMTKTNLDSSDFVDDRRFSSASLSSNEYAKITKSKSSSIEREGSKGSGRVSQTQKKNLIRSFSGTVRAPALFEISLKKKSRKRKPTQLTIESKNRESSRNDVFPDVTCSQNSTTESSPTSSTSNSSLTEQELNGKGSCIKRVFVTLNHEKQAADDLKFYSSSSVGLLCVLTMSLGLTLFYGRLCAVIFTTICLYFFPLRRNYEVALPESTTRTSPQDMEVSARDYRKRVIMEGMLERNNPRRIP